MRAILIATGVSTQMGTLSEQFAAPMLPLVDRPFIQHVVERLATSGIIEFDIVVSHLAHQIEELFEDGQRWGVTIRYHVARDAARPYRLLKTMSPLIGEAPVLLVHADRLLDISDLPGSGSSNTPIIYRETVSTHRSSDTWSGWAWIRQEDFRDLALDATETILLQHLLTRDPNFVEVEPGIGSYDFPSFLNANKKALQHNAGHLLIGGREVEPGIWISRNVVLHPTAKVTPPVYLCEDTQITEGVEIGPNAILGSGCILDRRCSVRNSVIFPSSYVGEGLELDHMIVLRSHLFDVKHGTEVFVDDELLLANASSRALGARFGKLLSRGTAVLALLLTGPILLLISLFLKLTRKGPLFANLEVVTLPTTTDPSRWRTYKLLSFQSSSQEGQLGTGRVCLKNLLFRFLPGLVNVARGDLRFVGVPPRSREEILNLPEDWRCLYLRAKAGLIAESSLLQSDTQHHHDYHVSDAYYFVSAGLIHDFKMVMRYLVQALCRWSGDEPAVEEGNSKVRIDQVDHVVPH
jgi:lipopolysaccharide/colanic/teichoic acid biosynthesis glycosyltransferase